MMKKIVLSIIITSSFYYSQAQNVGINTDGTDPYANTILHIKNDATSSLDSALLRIENGKSTSGTGVQIHNSGQATTTAQWDIIVPGSSTDLRIKGNGSDHVTIQNDGDVGVGTTSPVSGLDIHTSMGLHVTTITANTLLNQTHNVVLCNSGPYEVDLPAAASNTGKIYYIKNIDADAGVITIDGNGTDSIDGYPSLILNMKNHVIRIVSDGSNWQVLGDSYESPRNEYGRTCNGAVFAWDDVTNPLTGRTWMDRNLGAVQAATSSTDLASYGDYYQWGRVADGHECKTSPVRNTQSSSDIPGHGDFIACCYDWANPSNPSLVFNPCPTGYSVPTNAEWLEEIDSWDGTLGDNYTNNNAQNDAMNNTVLRLPIARFRAWNNGGFNNNGWYWTSTSAKAIWITSTNASLNSTVRGNGMSVRCIKNL